MIIKCKINEVIGDEINKVNKILIVNISIIKKEQGFFKESYEYFEQYTFVFLKNSSIAKEIISNPNQNIYFDLNKFTLRKIKFDYIKNDFAYLHNTLITTLNNEKSKQVQENNDIYDSINECILSTHIDMGFYFFYFWVIEKEFENIKHQDYFSFINKRYEDLMSVIIIQNYKLRYENYEELSNEEIEEIEEIYFDAIFAIKNNFEMAISDFINQNTKAKNISQNILKNENNSIVYLQKTVINAYEIILKRLDEYKYSTNYFGHNFTLANNRIDLIIFPTPYAISIPNTINELHRKNKIEEYLISYLDKNNIIIIENEELTKKLKTKWIFKVKGIISLFYLNNSIELTSCNLGNQNINNLLDSLFNKGQINLSTLNNYLQ